MKNIYTDGQYLEVTQTWHSEDSAWKARQIKKIIDMNKLQLNSIAEIGCGSGSILNELSKQPDLRKVCFEGCACIGVEPAQLIEPYPERL